MKTLKVRVFLATSSTVATGGPGRYAQMAAEQDLFTIDDPLDPINKKPGAAKAT